MDGALLADKIKSLCKERGISVSFLLHNCKINPNFLYDLRKKNISPSGKTIEKIADYLDVSPAFFLSEKNTDSSFEPSVFDIKNISPLPSGKRIPIVGTIACGTPITAQQNIEGYVDLDEGNKADFALNCKGDSMSPKFIDSDLVLIHSQPTVENGQIAAVLIDGEATLKRVYYQEGKQLVLSPENPRFQPIVLTGHRLEDVSILGEAIGFIRYF